MLTGSGHIRIRFGPQQILEYATPAPSGSGTTVRGRQDVPVYGPDSDVVVTVASALPPIELNVAGILGALSRFPLAVPAGTPSLGPTAPPPRAQADAYALLAARSAAPGPARDRLLAEPQAEHRARVTERVRRLRPAEFAYGGRPSTASGRGRGAGRGRDLDDDPDRIPAC